MDKRIESILKEKLDECMDGIDTINSVVHALQIRDGVEALILGIIIGRLYNSFYYQHRRILARDPTQEELDEFIAILKHSIEGIRDKIDRYLYSSRDR
jgi:hypothetical protein